jgi:RNA polymerase sigma factor (sigma-70 family)
LTDPERRLLAMRYVEGRSQRDIATDLGISQSQVSRQETRVLERLRRLVAGPEDQSVESAA